MNHSRKSDKRSDKIPSNQNIQLLKTGSLKSFGHIIFNDKCNRLLAYGLIPEERELHRNLKVMIWLEFEIVGLDQI